MKRNRITLFILYHINYFSFVTGYGTIGIPKSNQNYSKKPKPLFSLQPSLQHYTRTLKNVCSFLDISSPLSPTAIFKSREHSSATDLVRKVPVLSYLQRKVLILQLLKYDLNFICKLETPMQYDINSIKWQHITVVN